MSLIEQAARRLEALRQAGADLPGQAAPETVRPSPAGGVGTPEAVVRALEAQRSRLDSALAEPGAVARTVEPAVARAPSRPARTTTRRVDFDLERLRARGFVTPDMLSSQIAEEFRVIKRPILANVAARDGARVANGNLIMVTSAVAGEGKTFTAVNLALSIAMEYDHTVLLVDGDVAHPSLPSLLGVPDSPGLLDLLTDERVDVADALVRTNVEKLMLLPSGSPQRRATELLASEQMRELLSELSSRYPDRIIVFDSPPLLPTTEARVLASRMGQVLLVVAAETTSQNSVSQALTTIETCPVVLTMLNKASSPAIGNYYGYYPADRR
jgi:receptor protein-tyrosine kinase